MASCAGLRTGKFWMIGVVTILALSLPYGCNGSKPPEPTAKTTVPADPQPTASLSPDGSQVVTDPRLQQSFSEATVSEPPTEWFRPPDTTITQKSVGKLYTEVVRLWDEIKFVSPEGKRLEYRAVLDTEMGPIEITMRPDLAPNHCRSFIALCKAGYYDGLFFDRAVRQEVEGRSDKLELLEAGCPLGTGETGYGSIGYWLKPEINAQATHDEGAVGACHGEETDTAACKFYINLGKAPAMDGNYTIFGKVTQGLDVARKVFSLPVRNDPEFPEGDRPIKPVSIRKIAIHVQDEGASPSPH